MPGFCPRCGRPLDGGGFEGLCLDCFLETRRLVCVPEKIVFDYCKQCGSVRLGHRWLPGGEVGEASAVYLEKLLEERLRPCTGLVEELWIEGIEPVTVPSWRTMYRVIVAARLRGYDGVVRQDYLVEVRANPTLCPLCKDARGGEYNVLLQIRGVSPAELAKRLEGLLNTNDQVLGSLVDLVEKRNGVDMFLLDRGSASKIVRELKKHYRVKVRVTGEDVGTTSTGLMRRRTVISVSVSRRARR